MITVQRYSIVFGQTTLMLPATHRIIHAGLDDYHSPSVWVWLDDAMPRNTSRTIIMTSAYQWVPGPDTVDYIGSFKSDMSETWHGFADRIIP